MVSAFAEGAADGVQTGGCGGRFAGALAIANGIGILVVGRQRGGRGVGHGELRWQEGMRVRGIVTGLFAKGSLLPKLSLAASWTVLADGLIEALGLGGLTGRIEDDKAARTDSRGGRGEAGWDESKVQETPLAGVHRGEEPGFAGGLDGGNGVFGEAGDGSFATCLKTCGIEGKLLGLIGFEAEDRSCKTFERVEEFAVALQQERGVWAGERDLRAWRLRGGGIGFTGRDGVLETQTAGGAERFEEASERRLDRDEGRHREGVTDVSLTFSLNRLCRRNGRRWVS